MVFGGLTAVHAQSHVPAHGISFQNPRIYSTTGVFQLATADFDGDQRVDIAAAGGRPGQLSLLYGKGDGSFEDAVSTPLGQELNQVIAADLNGDGLPDLAVAHFTGNAIVVLINRGHREFAPPVMQIFSDFRSSPCALGCLLIAV